MKTQKFASACQQGRYVLILACLFLGVVMTENAARASGAVLLSFSSEHCGPCQAMHPVIDGLEAKGVPVRRINVNEEPEFARRHGIRQTPTFVVWSSGRELTRLVGMQSAAKLYEALTMNAGGQLVNTEASFPAGSQQRVALPATEPAPSVSSESMPSMSVAQAVERAQAATVRLKVQDGRGFGVGTGTIIDTHGQEALVLTCGHLFRESKLESQVKVELFVGGQIKTVPGKVVDFDSEEKDIALVVIQPGFEVSPVPVAPVNEPPQTGQPVFSFGCDHGDDPSRRDTRITGVNKYNQHLNLSNLEIAGAPVDGRSGGGLFDSAGRLVGVCNAADYKGDLGIYTGPGSVQWQLDRVQLSHLYQQNGSTPPQAAPPTPAVPSNSPFDQAPPTRLASLDPPGNAPPRPAVNALAQSSPGHEMIVIVRDPNQPGGERVLTVAQPTAELMEMIGRHAR